MRELPLESLPVHDEDDADSPYDDSPAQGADGRQVVRLIICMSPFSSERLARARYLQSDIAFKRVAGFLEFEIGGLDENANLGVPLFYLIPPVLY